jgi:hypothetical protein
MLAAFLRKPSREQRLLAAAAALHVIVAIAVRILPFGRVRRLLDPISRGGHRPQRAAGAEGRVIQAVRTVSAALPGATCLTEALVARVLLRRVACETTLCFGVSNERPAGRRFDAHAWLERRGLTLVGHRDIVYAPLVPPTRCAPSQPLR